jgi:transposase
MAQNFIGCDRDQSFLLPPDVRDWLPDGHLAWFVLDAVAGMDLSGFYGAYRADGVGRRAYDPSAMVALLYGYSRGVRSARKIERACEEDIAFKVIAMLETPDHATIARFVERHEVALAELFGQVLGLCAEAGLVRPGVVAIDGTKMAGNASRESIRDFAQLAREIVAEAKAIDEAEDELYGEERGDELPEELRTREGRAEFFRRAREQHARDQEREASGPELVPNPGRIRRRGSRSMSSGSSLAVRVGRGGGVKVAASWSTAVGRFPILSRGRVRIGCCSPRDGWRSSVTRRSWPTTPMRNTARPDATPRADDWASDRTHGSRRRCPTG